MIGGGDHWAKLAVMEAWLSVLPNPKAVLFPRPCEAALPAVDTDERAAESTQHQRRQRSAVKTP